MTIEEKNLHFKALLIGRLVGSVALASILLAFGCSRDEQTDGAHNSQEITVAAAANLTEAFAEIGKQFTARTGIRVIYSLGATAYLAKQIENGAPFDVFASADTAHVDALVGKGFVAPSTRALYARGRLVLWTPPQGRITLDRIEDLMREDLKILAVAKPDVAPYGQAALETLQALNLWSQVEKKIVYAQNVAQTKQYATSGNADAAFLPLALIKPGEGRFIQVEDRLHKPIDQALGVIQTSTKQEEARRFVEFVLSDEGQMLLERFGYRRPAAD